jgi:hypothetical protein
MSGREVDSGHRVITCYLTSLTPTLKGQLSMGRPRLLSPTPARPSFPRSPTKAAPDLCLDLHLGTQLCLTCTLSPSFPQPWQACTSELSCVLPPAPRGSPLCLLNGFPVPPASVPLQTTWFLNPRLARVDTYDHQNFLLGGPFLSSAVPLHLPGALVEALLGTHTARPFSFPPGPCPGATSLTLSLQCLKSHLPAPVLQLGRDSTCPSCNS